MANLGPNRVHQEGDRPNPRSAGGETKVEWVEAVPSGRFHLRVGLGRKASGWYYTAHSFVRFLVQPNMYSQFK